VLAALTSPGLGSITRSPAFRACASFLARSTFDVLLFTLASSNIVLERFCCQTLKRQTFVQSALLELLMEFLSYLQSKFFHKSPIESYDTYHAIHLSVSYVTMVVNPPLPEALHERCSREGLSLFLSSTPSSPVFNTGEEDQGFTLKRIGC